MAGRLFIACLTVAGVLLALAGATATSAAPAPPLLTPMAVNEQEAGKPIALAVKVTDPATNRAVGSVEVQFLVLTQTFGDRLMPVGQAISDSTGRAAISYKPSWEGDTKVVYRFKGNSQYGPVETTSTFSAVGPIPVHENAKFGLEPIRAWAPVVVVLLVLSVWAVLIMSVLNVARATSPRVAYRPAVSGRPVSVEARVQQDPVFRGEDG